MAQAVDFIIDGGILLNIGVGRGDIRLRLVIIVVGYEIFYRILGKNSRSSVQSCAASVLLCASTSVGRWVCLDDVRHGERLARAGNAHQRLLGQTVADALHQFGYRLRLIARHLVGLCILKSGKEIDLPLCF